MVDKKKINLSDDLITKANVYLERLPKTPEDVIEHWTLLGQKLTEEMTELQIMQFLLGDLDIELKEKNQK